MTDSMAERTIDSKLAYLVTHYFLDRVYWLRKYEDLGILVSGMPLSGDGLRSLDPALIHDWAKAVGDKGSFTSRDAMMAAKSFLKYWYDIGPQDEIKSVIEILTGMIDGRPDSKQMRELWDSCWETVIRNAEAGSPYRTTYTQGFDAEGNAGWPEWTPEKTLQFIKADEGE